MDLIGVLVALSPIVGPFTLLCLCCWLKGRRDARKRRADRKASVLAMFLEEVVEPELYDMLKGLPEDLSFTLGIDPGPATTSYRVFDALGGVKVLSPNRARWWEEKVLRHLARKFGLEVGYISGYLWCEHPIRFAHPPRLKARGAYPFDELV